MTALTDIQPAPVVTVDKQPMTQRLTSVDALRGFDMFMIIGADSLAYALRKLNSNAFTDFLADPQRGQLEHAEWAGFHFYDLIFPLFVFLAGVSTVFSLTKTIATVGRGEAMKRVFRRGILLFIIGIFYSGGFSKAWPDMRLMGVLNRIALAYLFTGLLFCFCKPKVLVGICAAILIGYWAAMSFVPIRDIQLTRANMAKVAAAAGDQEIASYYANEDSPNPSTVPNSPAWAAAQRYFHATTTRVTGKFDKGYNLSDHLDFQYLPGKRYDTFFDPEGFLSTIPAIGTCLLGVFAGLLLMNGAVAPQKKVIFLLLAGVLAVTLGWAWGFQFPVVKKIWTSSFVLVAGGYSALLLAAFYQIIEIWGWRGWCLPFIWMGMNSITIYLTKNILGGGFQTLAKRFAGGDVKTFFDTHWAPGAGDLMIVIVGLVMAFAFVRFLYNRKIFLRL